MIAARVPMQTPEVHLAYTPRGIGLQCALAYAARGEGLCGWFTGPADGRMLSAFFRLERFYAAEGTRFLATDGADVYGGWAWDYSDAHARRIGPEPLPDALCHELVRLQDAIAHEWLVYRDDPRAAAESERYAQAELALGEVNVRFDRLARFSKLQPTWTYFSPHFARGVVEYLAGRWALDYRLED